uniref:6-hydroxymethylpterin diphosphokinase MptE-like domain-containing protein n=1 Tax=viral metagenome TaxID=1070528 RepID=A0A6H1ZK10_9ZZZZ
MAKNKPVPIAPIPWGASGILGAETWRKKMQEVTAARWSEYMPVRDAISKSLDTIAGDLWVKNLKANKARIRAAGDAQVVHRGKGRGRACILAGAGPSLASNYEALYKTRNHIILTCVNSNLKFLLGKGIRPDLVVACDGDPIVAEHLDIGKTNIPLVCSTLVSPEVLSTWEGPISFLWYDLDALSTREQRRWLQRDEHFARPFPSSGSVFNMGFLFAHIVMHCTTFIFCGLDLAWWAKEELHVGENDGKEGFKVLETALGDVETDYALMRDKLWLEETISRMNVFVINATEAGIFGIHEGGLVPGIAHMTLSNAIGLWNWNRAKWEEEQAWQKEESPRGFRQTSSAPSPQ